MKQIIVNKKKVVINTCSGTGKQRDIFTDIHTCGKRLKCTVRV